MDINKIIKIDMASSDYPERLKDIPDPPKQIYCAGDISLLNRSSVGIVGSRKFTIYGKNVALMIGKRIAESGMSVVSGLAIGIDSYAHEGMIEADGKGIAVLGSGIREMGPARNRGLMMEMLKKGGVIVSEYEPDFPAKKWTYPARNRIISGLSSALVVVEANFNSGALITAQHAMEQGRPVYAVPGNINSQFSMGSNLLIRDGAIPLIVIDDIIRDLGCDLNSDNCVNMNLGPDENSIVEVVAKYNGVSPDVVARTLNMTVGQVNSIVTVLEIKGAVSTYSGKIHLAKRQ